MNQIKTTFLVRSSTINSHLKTQALCATIRLVHESLGILRLDVALFKQELDISQLPREELCSETRLTEPRRNGPSDYWKRLDHTIHVVVVWEVRSIRVCGQI